MRRKEKKIPSKKLKLNNFACNNSDADQIDSVSLQILFYPVSLSLSLSLSLSVKASFFSLSIHLSLSACIYSSLPSISLSQISLYSRSVIRLFLIPFNLQTCDSRHFAFCFPTFVYLFLFMNAFSSVSLSPIYISL